MEEKAKIVYKDEDILVLNKKAGVVCTKEGRQNSETLEDWLIEKFEDNKIPRQGIVHRLDKGTSGLMVVARTTEARNKLLEIFRKREIKKVYLALIGGDLPEKGEVKVPIARSKYVFGKFAASEEGKEAETHFKIIKKYKHLDKVYSLIEINLMTGRTHQIRVHFSYLGWPLVGDLTYGGKELLGLKRPFLQAKKLEFGQPMTGKELSFESDLADDLQEVLDQL
ncbi:MAG: Pseudouridine synthase [Candidatus Shapirobacteria bacterium GW2011_GWE1_38_10]|uniref:Pseudouridine synthase n=1 Tax=Candidatus Shapirobacteria bacterium GW2011_GWE1_38_10 TaxID=1618488 RepID=A0A0G0I7E4_9BACT|nr:MAG: Pseudouridine synthase [Candidatus Shapirobacteria bacterium GW2011_GWF2_37_20]KKQ50467.1 MAG: Pseudouridine synthase [Candidatus Shapirobacteria bacterium GW2011_GWE1_38_10]KKQ65123.1 MAG: Pseudouridine synthase [Candidatus Shapirobacteria bacterium GW2011_GWF1_38_23]HBP50879.1 RluA family pseudouridine synthase [Candidatus Shapirobacteria bacterium]